MFNENPRQHFSQLNFNAGDIGKYESYDYILK